MRFRVVSHLGGYAVQGEAPVGNYTWHETEEDAQTVRDVLNHETLPQLQVMQNLIIDRISGRVIGKLLPHVCQALH